MAEREYEYQNPDDPYATPYASAPPPADPWSSDEANAATAQFQQFLSTHPGYGDSSDGLRQYQALRQQGQSHDAALSGAFSSLGWVDQGAPPPTTTDPGAPAPAPTGSPAPGPTIDSTNPGIPGAPAPTGPAPTYTSPTYTRPPAYVPPPAFKYDDFEGPSASDLFDDPGYRLRKSEGESGIERSAAARGVLNTGGNLKDILRFGQDLASQEYRGLFDRKFSTYQANRSNAFDTYKTNYGIGKDAYDTNYTTQYKDPFAYEQQGSRDAYDSRIHNYDQNQFYTSHNTDLDRMYAWNAKIQAYNEKHNDRMDSFDEKYKILGLL